MRDPIANDPFVQPDPVSAITSIPSASSILTGASNIVGGLITNPLELGLIAALVLGGMYMMDSSGSRR